MTIRRQWMLVLILSVVLSVVVNTFVMNILISSYFVDYSTENYNHHISSLEDFSGKVLSGNNYSTSQIEMQLESHLSDPIYDIKLYNKDGNMIAIASSNTHMKGMMGNRMMNRMMGHASQEVDAIDIINNNDVIGKLIVTRYSSIGNSITTRKFVYSLLGSSLLSFGIVFLLIFIIGMHISKKLSKDLRLTAQQALDIDLMNTRNVPKSNVIEIRTIQHSLETLQTRLKLKQTSRKELVDQLVHQTRTPLTILRTHLEGFQDGIIQLDSNEIKTCEDQIENITSIITNMSAMIDAGKDSDTTNFETVEINQLLKQIANGLIMQFEKKDLQLELLSHQKLSLETDRYQLSQVIYNLLTNAYKFTEPKGKVTIAYEELVDEIKIVVEDNGIGMSDDEQLRIFNAYYRGKNSLNTPGEGIGLYLVKENLIKLNGNIYLESKPGQGSKFVITLPKKQSIVF